MQATLVECQLSSHVVVRVRLSLHLLGGLGGRAGGIPLILRQMVAGLGKEEWEELGLEGVARDELGLVAFGRKSENGALPRQFSAWRTSLAQLGIPFSDLVRVFASILLLQNLNEGDILEQNKRGLLRKLSHLLGVQHKSLLACLNNQSVLGGRSQQQSVKSRSWSETSNCLATSLYQRTLLTVVRRINCPGTGSSLPSTGLSVSLLDSPSILQRGNSSGLHLLGSNMLSETIQVFNSFVCLKTEILTFQFFSTCSIAKFCQAWRGWRLKKVPNVSI